MWYIVKFKEYDCEQLEGYTDNEFIFRQYVKQLQKTFPYIKYELLAEPDCISEQAILEQYGFKRLQRYRTYESADGTVTVYCNIAFMSDWLGVHDGNGSPWSYSSREKIPALYEKFLNAVIIMNQMIWFMRLENPHAIMDMFRRVLIYAIMLKDGDRIENTKAQGPVIDPIKLMAYVNRFPNDNEAVGIL